MKTWTTMLSYTTSQQHYPALVTLAVVVLSGASFAVAQERFVPDRVTNRLFIVTNGTSPPFLRVPKEWQPYLWTPARGTSVQYVPVGEWARHGVLTLPRG